MRAHKFLKRSTVCGWSTRPLFANVESNQQSNGCKIHALSESNHSIISGIRHYASSESNHSIISGSPFQASQQTFGWHHSKNAREAPFANSLRVSHQRVSFSNAELKKQYEAVATGLIESGVRPGDRVMMIQPSNAEVVVTQLACLKIGAALTLVPNTDRAGFLTRLLNFVRPRVLMMPTKYGETDYLMMARHISPQIKKLHVYNIPFKSRRFPFLKQIVFTDPFTPSHKLGHGYRKFSELMVFGPQGYYESPLRRIALHINANHPALILIGQNDKVDPWSADFKPYVYSQKNLVNAGLIVGSLVGIEQSDRVMVTNHHLDPNGAIVANFSAIMNKATIVIPSEEYNVEETLKMLQLEGPTVLFSSVNELKQMLKHPSFGKLNFDHLKKIVTFDGELNASLEKEITQSFGVERVHSFDGIKETCGLLFFDGKLVPGTELKVLRKDDKVLHKDTWGEVKIRGPTTALGYWTDLGLQEDTYDTENWFRVPGKMAKLGENGKLVWA